MDNDLDKIVKENVPKLHSYVSGRVNNKDDADDIVQDTLYQFLRTISVLENPIAHVSSWLYTVAHNLIINHGKKHREMLFTGLQRNNDGDDDNDFIMDLSDIMMSDDADNPDMQMLRTMVWDEWQKALDELPDEQRKAIVMTEIEGLSVKESARQMGVSVNTFLSRKHYAVKHVRKRLYALYQELIHS